MKQDPVLGCRVVDGVQGPRFEKRDDLDAIEPLWLTTDEPGSLERFIVTPADPRIDPFIRVSLFRSSADTVCIKVNHVVSDASGAKEYARRLCSLYNGLARDPPNLPPQPTDSSRGISVVLKGTPLKKKLAMVRGWSKYGPLTEGDRPEWHFPHFSMSTEGRAMLTRSLGQTRLGVVRAYAKGHEATINDVLFTAFCSAMFEVIEPPFDTPLPFQVQADLRQFCGPQAYRRVHNLALAYFPTIVRRRGDDFESLLVRVKKEMDARKAGDEAIRGIYPVWLITTLLPWTLASAYFDRMVRRQLRDRFTVPLFTNMGSLSPQSLSFAGTAVTDAYLTAPVAYPPYFTLGITSFRESLTLSIGFCLAGVCGEDVEQIARLIDTRLPG
jgi:NRPS condensation-like uncharacterized protein